MIHSINILIKNISSRLPVIIWFNRIIANKAQLEMHNSIILKVFMITNLLNSMKKYIGILHTNLLWTWGIFFKLFHLRFELLQKELEEKINSSVWILKDQFKSCNCKIPQKSLKADDFKDKISNKWVILLFSGTHYELSRFKMFFRWCI